MGFEKIIHKMVTPFFNYLEGNNLAEIYRSLYDRTQNLENINSLNIDSREKAFFLS